MCCSTKIIQILGGGGGPIVNIYNSDGTLTGVRTVNQNNQNITWNTGTAAFIINGKLTVTGMIDPIGVQFTTSNSVAVGATGVGKGTIFVSDGAGGLNLDHPYFKDAAGTLFDLLQAGTNIYTADGTVTSPVRTMTIGTSKVDFNATSALSETTNFHQEGSKITLNSVDGTGNINSLITTEGVDNIIGSNNGPLDRGATITTSETAQIYNRVYQAASSLIFDINFTTPGNPYFDFAGGSSPFEIRLQGNPGNAGEVLTSNGPLAYPTWSPVTVTANSLDNLSFTTDIDWDFNNNDWNLNNIDALNIDANSFNLNSPVVCFTGITQNDTLNRFMVQDAGGCISWRDVSTLPGAGGGVTLADNGVSISGGTTAQLGTPLAGTGVPFTVNRYVDLAGKQFSFTDNTGASRVLLVEATQNQAWRSDYYDLSSSTIQHQKADRPAFMTNLGHLQMQDRVVRRAVTNVSADYTVVPTTDEHIHVDTTGGPVTITLASLAPAGATSARRQDQGTNDWFQYLTISRHGGNTLTIQAAGGQTIDFAASITVNNNRGVSIQGISTTEWVTINNA